MTPSRRKFLFGTVLAAAAIVCGAPAARAQLKIEITSGVTDPIPIAIVPFASAMPQNADAGTEAARVVQSDLQGTGRFRAMPWSQMTTKPSQASDVVLPQWRKSGNDYVVVGRVYPVPGGKLVVDFQLLNALNGQQLASERFTGSPAALRNAAHRVSNVIYQKILGVRGAFDTRIAYVAVEGKPPAQQFQLVIADADGKDAHVILQSNDPVMSPAWSPDGKQLAYVSFEHGRSAVYVQQVATGARQVVSDRVGVNSAPAWSPDGRKLALALSTGEGGLNIYVLDLSDGHLTRLTSDPAIDTSPVWSPDGRWVYFTSDRGGGPQIYRIGAEPGDHPTRITFEGSYDADPRISPDGTELAMVSEDAGQFRIAVENLATGTVRFLSAGPLDKSPSFAPNGAMVIFAATAGGHSILQRASLDGLTSQRLTSARADVRDPVWGPFRHY